MVNIGAAYACINEDNNKKEGEDENYVFDVLHDWRASTHAPSVLLGLFTSTFISMYYQPRQFPPILKNPLKHLHNILRGTPRSLLVCATHCLAVIIPQASDCSGRSDAAQTESGTLNEPLHRIVLPRLGPGVPDPQNPHRSRWPIGHLL